MILRATLREVVITGRLVLVPRAEVEPARPYNQRILSPKKGYSNSFFHVSAGPFLLAVFAKTRKSSSGKLHNPQLDVVSLCSLSEW